VTSIARKEPLKNGGVLKLRHEKDAGWDGGIAMTPVWIDVMLGLYMLGAGMALVIMALRR